MEHLREVGSDAFTAHSSFILETYTLCNKIRQQFLKALQFIDTNSLESQYIFTERKCQQYLVPLSFLQPLSRIVKSYFSFFERQLFQRSGHLADIANRVVCRNVRGTDKFIKEKLVGTAWHGRPNSLRKICGAFLFLFYA